MQYAYIDIHGDKRVLSWIDTEANAYVLPDPQYLRPVSEQEWALKDTGSVYMLADDESLVPYVPTPTQPTNIKPRLCTQAQGLVALFAIKRITEDDVLAAIARIPDEVERYTARIGYQRTTTWECSSPTMQTMAQLLQLSETDLDELFAYAVNVQV